MRFSIAATDEHGNSYFYACSEFYSGKFAHTVTRNNTDTCADGIDFRKTCGGDLAGGGYHDADGVRSVGDFYYIFI